DPKIRVPLASAGCHRYKRARCYDRREECKPAETRLLCLVYEWLRDHHGNPEHCENKGWEDGGYIDRGEIHLDLASAYCTCPVCVWFNSLVTDASIGRRNEFE